MTNCADAELIFRKESRVQRNLVPIGQRPSAFETDGLEARTAVETLGLDFCRQAEPIRQPHLNLLREKVVGRTIAEITLVNCPEEKCPWRQNVRRSGRRCTRARKPRRRTIRAWDFLPGDDDAGYALLRGEFWRSEKKRNRGTAGKEKKKANSH